MISLGVGCAYDPDEMQKSLHQVITLKAASWRQGMDVKKQGASGREQGAKSNMEK